MAVAIDAGRFARQQLLAEDRHHASLAVWVLPGTVDVGIPEGDRRHLVLLGKKLQIPFAHPLGDAVGADRIGWRRLGSRRRHFPIEHAAARREDNAAAAVPGRSLEHVDQSNAVDLGIEEGLADRPAHRHLRRLMADRIGPCRLEHAGNRLRIDDVGDMQRHAGGQVVARPAGEVVEHLDAVPRRQKPVDDMAANESGTAGDEDVHFICSKFPAGTVAPAAPRVCPGQPIRARTVKNNAFPVVLCLGTMRPADCLTLLDRQSTMYIDCHEFIECALSAAGSPSPIRVPGTFPCILRFSDPSWVRACPA